MSDLETTTTETTTAQDLSGTTEHRNDEKKTSVREETISKAAKTNIELSDLPEEWAEEIRRLRKENAARRVSDKESNKGADEAKRAADEARDVLSQLKEFKDSIAKDLLETKQKMAAAEKRAISAQLEVEAKKVGVVDLEIFQKMVDHSSLKVGDDGKLVGVEDVLKNMKQKHPVLFDNRTSKNTGNYGIPPKPTFEVKKDLSVMPKKDYQKEKAAHMRNIAQNY